MPPFEVSDGVVEAIMMYLPFKHRFRVCHLSQQFYRVSRTLGRRALFRSVHDSISKWLINQDGIESFTLSINRGDMDMGLVLASMATTKHAASLRRLELVAPDDAFTCYSFLAPLNNLHSLLIKGSYIKFAHIDLPATVKYLHFEQSGIKAIEFRNVRAPGLTTLALVNCNLQMLPYTLKNFTDTLKVLVLDGNHLDSGTNFGVVKNITKLSARRCYNPSKMFNQISILTKLEELDLSYNSFRTIHPIHESLTRLTSLNFSHNQLECTSDISTMHSLKVLDISCNPLHAAYLPLNLVKLTVSEIPRVLSLHAIEELVIHRRCNGRHGGGTLSSLPQAPALASVKLSAINRYDKCSTVELVQLLRENQHVVFSST